MPMRHRVAIGSFSRAASSGRVSQVSSINHYRQRNDLVDPITLLIATGARRSELLGFPWTDWDEDADTIAVTGKVVRGAGKGLVRIEDTKSQAGKRRLPLPRFAIDALRGRRSAPCLGEQPVLPVDGGHAARPGQFSASTGARFETARPRPVSVRRASERRLPC
jgi:integrase